jgi:hypothetical protein
MFIGLKYNYIPGPINYSDIHSRSAISFIKVLPGPIENPRFLALKVTGN